MTFDRNTAIRHAEADFFALGHPFIDKMLGYIGDYEFSGHTAVRVLAAPWISELVSGLQFNFTVRKRVQRGDGTEYLFDLYTVVVRSDGKIDHRLAELAVSTYSIDSYEQSEPAGFQPNATTIESAYHLAKSEIERRVKLWDWDEDVDLVGLAKLIAIPNPTP